MSVPTGKMLNQCRLQWRRLRHAHRARVVTAARERLAAIPVVAVTGSASKTTTVKLTAHLLGGEPRVGVSMYANTARDVLGAFARFGPDTEAAVLEASEFPLGNLDGIARLVRPTVAVTTVSGLDHYKEFRGAAGAAQEMACLLRAVPTDGFAVLNADDEQLSRLRTEVAGRVISFGRNPNADYQATELTAAADHRLVVNCHHRDQQYELQTPFLGAHFHVATLAAVATAHQLGVSWPTIQSRLRSFEPVFGRCSLLAIPDGPVFICDTIKSPAWSVQASFSTLEAFATAPRRTLVLGTLSDYGGSSRKVYRTAWSKARPLVDRTVFLRHSPSHVGATEADSANGEAVFLQTAEEIARHLTSTQLPGEVILLKGSSTSDHLDRIAHSFARPVTCWRERCGRSMNCINCEWLYDRTPAPLRPLAKLRHKLLGPRRIYG